jgi:predicted DNA-binding protein with PD1-like motif
VRWRGVQGGWAIVFEHGDDVLPGLLEVARAAGVQSGAMTGLGAVGAIQLAYYDLATKSYRRRDFEGDHEIGALCGNITRLDGEPLVHMHAVIGGPDFAAFTGHVMQARCGATLEVFLHDWAAGIDRRMDAAIGLNLCTL